MVICYHLPTPCPLDIWQRVKRERSCPQEVTASPAPDIINTGSSDRTTGAAINLTTPSDKPASQITFSQKNYVERMTNSMVLDKTDIQAYMKTLALIKAKYMVYKNHLLINRNGIDQINITSNIPSEISRMYRIWITALLGAWLLTRLVYQLGQWTIQHHIAASLGQCLSRELPWLLQAINIATAFKVILVGVLLGANIILLLMSAHGWADVQQRAAKLAILNLLPLSTGLTFDLPAHLLGISCSAVAWLHRWFRQVMAAYSLLHGAITITRADKPIPSMRHDWVPLLAAAAILMIIPVTLHVVVRRHYQITIRIHYLLAVTAMVALAYHIWDRGSDSRWQDFARASNSSPSISLTGMMRPDRPALLLGPYSRSINFSLFGTIVFIIKDIGMLQVLPYIRMLIQASEQRQAMLLTNARPPMLARQLDAGPVGPRPQ
ncbi:uncharacterized protein BO88DRAFT_427299 [Aspergillus vadensis CBS 113365]|uniref:Ferric oxidoreductase domain-containing protein n=1 Tax=Aspergillus vadensis (strain CBS 113365 / IMI 142717 / IBT 24658) TaxID=1448311 RepID=A0A319B5H9_ASPVC|nr:hypothetical protein BO88DRAFT_427299 [Aspergillus vadensis CBS 113365]PYH67151.1 hypothetical protein BO88DRAFT_427299 [Aspergillus vadensis CBS 113365]